MTTHTIAPSHKVRELYRLLNAAYGMPEWAPSGDPLGELIATILSQHTSDVNSHRAYAQLVGAFPTWEAVRDAPSAAVADAIRPGGLGALKAARIQHVLGVLTERLQGAALSLDLLAALDVEAGLAYLRGLPGVGPKTSACVLLFALGKPAFPVDTHVLRVCRRVGLIGQRTSADAAHAELAGQIPPDWRHALHVNLIRHGRQVCRAQRPRCDVCPLRSICDYYWQIVNTRE